MESEIARVRAEIEQEIIAMHRGLHGLAHVGGHEYITAKSENLIEDAVRKLAPLVGGTEEAMQTLCVIYVDADQKSGKTN